ncbi:MAG: hypothetical protein WB919_16855 [Candidatus Sulfotelmatobacter sp.]
MRDLGLAVLRAGCYLTARTRAGSNSEQRSARLYEIDVHEKHRVDRRILEKGTRDKTIKIGGGDVLAIANWAGRRYRRSSLPTAFLDRIPSKVKKKLSKKLDNDGEDVVGIYVAFDTMAELKDETPYRIILRVVVASQSPEDFAKEQRANSIVSEIRKWLGQCDGIEVEDADLATESEITLHDLRHMIRWDFDYLSPDEETSSENQVD